MDFAQQQRNPAKHIQAILIVVALHVLVIYALLTGLANRAIDVIKQPIETKIIEEVKPKEPEVPVPPPPKLAAPPPPAFIPPPEVSIVQPPPTVNTITAVTTVAPKAPVPFVASPPTVTASTSVTVACPNSQQVRNDIVYPRDAQRERLSGEVLIEFQVSPGGEIENPRVVKSSNRIFDRVSLEAVRRFHCIAQGREIRVQVPFGFKIED